MTASFSAILDAMAKKDRSINEVYEMLAEVFGFTKTQFEGVEKRFERVEKEFDGVHKRFGLVNSQLTIVNKDIQDIKEMQRETGSDVKMLKEDVVALGRSIYKQHKTLENHGRRLVKLEE